MLVGYARTSTADQVAGLDAQHRDLRATGCSKVFAEHVSSTADRVQLNASLEFVREGDTLAVTRLDRLARSTSDLLRIITLLEGKCVSLRVLDFGGSGIDTTSPTGRLMVTMFGALAQFERELMLQRQREGIAKARAEGRYKGRKPTARSKAPDVLRLKAFGLGATEIADQVGISRASVYRIFAGGPVKPRTQPDNSRPTLRPYNGFTKNQREAASKTIEEAIASGRAVEPTHCEICGKSADETRIFRHLEDYRRPMSFHGLCGKCHYYLHTRFWEAERWRALIQGKRIGWLHKLSLDEESRTRDFDLTYEKGLDEKSATLVDDIK